MKVFVKRVLIIIGILAGCITIAFIALYLFLYLLVNSWWNSSVPSSGIWQYSDDDLTITVYVPKDGGVSSSEGFLKCKAEISYNGNKQKAILEYHAKMYQYFFVPVIDYDSAMTSDSDISRANEIIDSTYRISNSKKEWEFKEIRTIFMSYYGKNLILKKIGKYQEPLD